MRDGRLELLDKDAVVVEDDRGAWFCVGAPPAARNAFASAAPDGDFGARFVQEHRNASVIRVDDEDGTVSMWRGLLGLSDIFFTVRPDGSIFVSDHFRNVVVKVPVDDRIPSEAAFTEHLLSLTLFDRRTYARPVHRLGQGDRADIRPDGEIVWSVADRFTAISDKSATSDAPEAVESALAAVMASIEHPESLCTTFSGGVDSTLLASFLADDSSLVAITTDTPEFEKETEYARMASDLMGYNFDEHRLVEQDYFELLERLIDQTGLPPAAYVSPLLSDIYTRSEDTFVLGEGADSIFGTDRGLRRIAGAFANPLGLSVLGVTQRLPGPIGRRTTQIDSYASKYAKAPTDLTGAAAKSLYFSDDAIVRDIVGSDTVDALSQSHLTFLHERIELEAREKDRFWAHMEMIAWRGTFADLSTAPRLRALAEGKRLVMPYLDSDVVDQLRRVPVKDRYIRTLAGKWILKEILADRVPGYPVNQRKNATGLPFERFYEQGPLTDVWDRYPFPDRIGDRHRNELVTTPNSVTWAAMTYSIWMHRIGRNAALTPHTPHIVRTVPSAGTRTASAEITGG